MPYLIEQSYIEDTLGTSGTLRVSTGAGLVTSPAASPANTPYERRIINPGNFERAIPVPATSNNASEVGYGVVILNNADGGLDWMKDVGVDGQTLTIRRGPRNGSYPADFPIIFQGTAETVKFDWTKVSLRIRDRKAEVYDKPVQQSEYAGDNVLPDGVEGVSDDLKGRKKPRLYGKVINISPPMVNTSKIVYQVAENQIQAINAVYDKGAALTAGTAYTVLADLMDNANAPAAGAYTTAITSTGAYIRLGSRAAGTVTVDATEGTLAADRTIAQIVKRVLVDCGGVLLADISGDTALDLVVPGEAGFWAGTSEMDVGAAIENALNGVYAYCLPTYDGKFSLGALSVPSGTAVKIFTEAKIVGTPSFDVVSIPNHKVFINYANNYTVQDASNLAGVAADRETFLRERFRTVSAEDSDVLTKHVLSVERTEETILVNESDANTQASRILGLVKHTRIMVKLRLQSSEVDSLDIGDVIEVKINRLGWSAGKLLRIISIAVDYQRNFAEVEGWC